MTKGLSLGYKGLSPHSVQSQASFVQRLSSGTFTVGSPFSCWCSGGGEGGREGVGKRVREGRREGRM